MVKEILRIEGRTTHTSRRHKRGETGPIPCRLTTGENVPGTVCTVVRTYEYTDTATDRKGM